MISQHPSLVLIDISKVMSIVTVVTTSMLLPNDLSPLLMYHSVTIGVVLIPVEKVIMRSSPASSLLQL